MDNIIGIVTKVWKLCNQIVRIEIVPVTIKDNGYCARPVRTVRAPPSDLDLIGLQFFHDIIARKYDL